jgi:hypothetical protein
VSDIPFPPVIFVSHYDHSTVDSPSLNACLKERDAIDAESSDATSVAMYKLVSVRKLALKIEEQP